MVEERQGDYRHRSRVSCKLRKFRAAARQAGLDANVWFGNVELGAAEVAGLTPVQYVGNIYKYYISYQLAVERLDAGRKAREDTGAEKRR